MAEMRVIVHSGSPSGAVLTIGDSRGGTEIANATLSNTDNQSVSFTQTTGSYTGQTGNMFLRIDDNSSGSTGNIQVLIRYYAGYQGSTTLGNNADTDTYISGSIIDGGPLPVQFID